MLTLVLPLLSVLGTCGLGLALEMPLRRRGVILLLYLVGKVFISGFVCFYIAGLNRDAL